MVYRSAIAAYSPRKAGLLPFQERSKDLHQLQNDFTEGKPWGCRGGAATTQDQAHSSVDIGCSFPGTEKFPLCPLPSVVTAHCLVCGLFFCQKEYSLFFWKQICLSIGPLWSWGATPHIAFSRVGGGPEGRVQVCTVAFFSFHVCVHRYVNCLGAFFSCLFKCLHFQISV